MKYTIKQIEQLVNSNRVKTALDQINAVFDNSDNMPEDLNSEEVLSLLRLKAKCELIIFKDKTYIKTLFEISSLSEHLNDKLVLIHQLIKEKEYLDAHDEYERLRYSTIFSNYKSIKQNKNQLLEICELFYRDYSLHLLKDKLRDESQKFIFVEDEALRVANFINELFNVKLYEEKSLRSDHRPSYLGYSNISEEPYIPFALKTDIELLSLLNEIKEEVLLILDKRQGKPYVKNIQGVPAGFDHLIGSNDWRSVDVYAGGKLLVAEGKALISLLKQHFDLADCAPLAPEVMISILEPGTHITPHVGTSNIKHTLHIPIVLPEGDLGIKVGGIVKKWKFGDCILFDDSFEHEAWNKTQNTRIVLIVDIWHNDLSFNERAFLKNIMPLIVSWRSKLNV